jgi:hypothetical protein
MLAAGMNGNYVNRLHESDRANVYRGANLQPPHAGLYLCAAALSVLV